MKYKKENDEIIKFCLKHEIIKKTNGGYIINKHFFEKLDYYEGYGGENYYDINWGTEKIYTWIFTNTS